MPVLCHCRAEVEVRDGEDRTQVAGVVRALQGVQVHVADLADPGDIAELERVAAAAEPDLLVTTPGSGGPRVLRRRPADLGRSGWRARARAGGRRLARAAIPAMIARGSGAIMNVASLLAFSGTVPPEPRHRSRSRLCRAVCRRQGFPGRVYPGAGGRPGRERGTGSRSAARAWSTPSSTVAGMDLAGIPFRPAAHGVRPRAGGTGPGCLRPGLPEPSMTGPSSETRRALFMTGAGPGRRRPGTERDRPPGSHGA